MACLWAGYIHKKADMSELVKFAGGAQFETINVARQEFSDLAEAVSHLEDCIDRNFIPWAAVIGK